MFATLKDQRKNEKGKELSEQILIETLENNNKYKRIKE